MKNNILIKFAINDLKNHRKDSIITMITIFIVSITVMLISLFTPYFTDDKYVEHLNLNGYYSHSVGYYSNDDKNKLEEAIFQINNQKYRLNDLKHCWIYSYGKTLQSETIDVLDGDYSILSIRLLEGNMPTNENEIAVKASVLENWGYEEKIGENAKFSFHSYKDAIISYVVDDENISSEIHNDSLDIREFKVVGILNEESTSSIVVGAKPTQLFTLRLYSGLNDETNDYFIIDNADEYELHASFRREDFNDLGTTNIILVIIQFVIWIVSLSLIYGLTLSSFEVKQKDFTLLRSIGATQRQIYFIILIQSLVLSLIPIVLSMIIVYFISLIFSMMSLYTMISFDLMSIISDGLIVLFVVFLSYFIPARSVTRKAMSGTFDGMKFQRIYYQYKKLHQLKPFYLAWRQLVSLKKKMIIKVFLVALVSIAAMSIVKSGIVIYHSVSQYNEIPDKYMLYLVDLEKNYDIENVKNYTDKVASTNYIYASHEYTNGMSHYENDICIYYDPYVYCQNEDFSDYYQLRQLNDNQLIISDTYVNDLNQDISEGSKVLFLNKEYEVIQIVDFPHDMIVLSENEYKNLDFEGNNVNQLVSVEFHDNNQKAKALLECKELMEIVSDAGSLYYRYDTTDVLAVGLLDADFFDVLKIICFSVIYIFQYSFELKKQKEDIGSYQLLGLTRKEISSIYFYKSFIIGIIGLICGGIYFYLDIYYIYNGLINYQYVLSIVNIGLMILGAILVIVVISFISLYPLLFILKNEGIENKNTRE